MKRRVRGEERLTECERRPQGGLTLATSSLLHLSSIASSHTSKHSNHIPFPVYLLFSVLFGLGSIRDASFLLFPKLKGN